MSENEGARVSLPVTSNTRFISISGPIPASELIESSVNAAAGGAGVVAGASRARDAAAGR